MLRNEWPAPKTFLLLAKSGVLPALRGKRRSKLAVRVPDHTGARRLCQALGMPLVSTSCNRAGKRACRTEREVRRQFGRDVWIVGGRIGSRNRRVRLSMGKQVNVCVRYGCLSENFFAYTKKNFWMVFLYMIVIARR
ncbi:telomere recombination family protein [Neisseria gonorrhoeae]|nr:telomere recombination family protein [Neisseria gonorrhoeae]